MKRDAYPRRGRSTRSNLPVLPATTLLIVILLVALFAWHRGTDSAAASGGMGNGAGTRVSWCGSAGQPACPIADPGWVTLTTSAPNTVAAMLATHKMFSAMQTRYGRLSLDLPALVHVFGPTGGSDYFTDDHWVVAARNSLGAEIGLFDLVYDAARHRIRFSGYAVLTSSDPRYGHPFPALSRATAMLQLSNQRRLLALAGSTPDLVFVPGLLGPSNAQQWTAGGASPLDPLWHIIGADGKHYFVGVASHVYALSELPLPQRVP